MLPGFFFDTVGSGIREQQKEAAAKAERDNNRELEILQILAQHGSDDVRGVAGTAWLDLANNPNRPRAKGLGGFLGQTEKSPYFKDIQTAISSAKVAPGPQPPSAGMSTNAPVSPGSAPIQPAPAGPPAPPAAPQTQAGQLDQSGQLAMSGPAGPEAAQGLPPIPTSPLVPPPPPPPKIRSLFPTSEELAKQKVDEATMLSKARYDTAAQAIQQYGGSQQQVQDAILGMSGAPRSRRPLAVPMILTVDGQEVLGVFDPDTQTYEVEGRPVQPTNARRPSTSLPKDPTVKTITDDNGNVTAYAPPKLQPGQSQRIGDVRGKTKTDPPQYSGTATVMNEDTGEAEVRRLPRGGGGAVVGKAPPRAGAVTDQSRQYKAWKEVVDKNLAALGKNMLGRTRVLTAAQRDQEAAKVSGNPQMTYNELQVGAQGGTVQPRGKSGLNPDEFKQFLNDLAKQFTGPPAGSTVQGGTTITPAPPPPK